MRIPLKGKSVQRVFSKLPTDKIILPQVYHEIFSGVNPAPRQ